MSDDVYEKLREFMDQVNPTGFPRTKSGVEIELLKKFFTPEQAKAVVHVRAVPETAEVIAERMCKSPEDAVQVLDGLIDHGLIMSIHTGDSLHYTAIPFMPGIVELNVWRVDAEISKLWSAYLDEAWGESLVRTDRTPLARTLPVQESVSVDRTILPYEKASEFIEKAPRPRIVTNCYCRALKKAGGGICDKPMEVCIGLGPYASHFLKKGLGREINDDEFKSILEKARDAGLVHTVVNMASFEDQIWMCNCCSCCCVTLSSINKFQKGDIIGGTAASTYIASIDEDTCIGCGICIDRCQVGALSMEDNVAKLKKGRCIGCGLCVTECPEGAIELIKRKDSDLPATPETVTELYQKILQERHS